MLEHTILQDLEQSSRIKDVWINKNNTYYKEFSKEESKKIQDFLRNEARKIVAINNIVLILTGLILFFTYWQHAPIILHIKATLGIVLVIAFFFIPKILNYFNAKQESRIKIHYLYFSLLLITVALSQYIYF